MTSTPENIKTWKAPAIALLGSAFCVIAAVGLLDDLCVTDGCRLYKDFSVAGISLWWWGTAGFILMVGLALMGKRRWAYRIAFLSLTLDSFLLAWMAVSAVCLNCLPAALAFVSVFFAFYLEGLGASRPARALVLLWFFFFIPNLFLIVQEEVKPWPISGPEQAGIKLYFSPTCPACHAAVSFLLPHADGAVAFIPLSRSQTDFEMLADMVRRMEEGQSFAVAFPQVTAGGVSRVMELNWREKLRLQYRLSRNSVVYMRMGARRIPLMLSSGAPVKSTADQ